VAEAPADVPLAAAAVVDVPAAGAAALAAALGDGTHTYTYDAENRLIKVDNGNTAIYTYDGEGHRASKTNNSGVNSGGNTPDPSGTVEFVYDSAGHLVHTESPNGGVGWRGEVFAGNRHLATYNGNADFSHSDWLGTERSRVYVPNSTQVYVQNLTSLPFGDWLDNGQGLGADSTPLNFTGQFHDFESNLDYLGARYYSSSLGRFVQPIHSHGTCIATFAIVRPDPSISGATGPPTFMLKLVLLRFKPICRRGSWRSLVVSNM
jgi:RHS repeat-associated protein